jgi:hypothetical protein
VTVRTHAYPDDLASFAREHWDEVPDAEPWTDGEVPEGPPSLEVLELLCSSAFQASLMRDEERPITFRLVFAEPEVFLPQKGPPYGAHRLLFEQPRPLDPNELRRLSQAAKYQRALLGVRQGPTGLQIWGIVHTGPRWLRAHHGGRGAFGALPPVPVVSVTGPGRIAVAKGHAVVARLFAGRLAQPEAEVFDSRWLPATFAPVRGEMVARHEEARARAPRPWADLDPDFVRRLGQQYLRRIIATIRAAHHGGTLVLVPPSAADRFEGNDSLVTLKHRFVSEEPRHRCRTLMLRTLAAVAEAYAELVPPGKAVGWEEYETLADPLVAELDEALFELAHLVASLADVDGAVVMTQRFELLGFGGVVSGELADVPRVARALDIEGEHRVLERTDLVGTRHQAAYRLCQAFPEALVIVISQDGGARFVRWFEGAVTYWDQVGGAAGDV